MSLIDRLKSRKTLMVDDLTERGEAEVRSINTNSDIYELDDYMDFIEGIRKNYVEVREDFMSSYVVLFLDKNSMPVCFIPFANKAVDIIKNLKIVEEDCENNDWKVNKDFIADLSDLIDDFEYYGRDKETKKMYKKAKNMIVLYFSNKPEQLEITELVKDLILFAKLLNKKFCDFQIHTESSFYTFLENIIYEK